MVEPKTPLRTPKKTLKKKPRRVDLSEPDELGGGPAPAAALLDLPASLLGNFLSYPAAVVLERRFAQRRQVSWSLIIK